MQKFWKEMNPGWIHNIPEWIPKATYGEILKETFDEIPGSIPGGASGITQHKIL